MPWTVGHKGPRMKDDDGEWVVAGDWITFIYGIPFVSVEAEIIERDGQLVAVDRVNSQGHELRENPLRSLRRHVGNWYRKPDTKGPAK